MRTIKEIILHCSATPEGRDYTVADIDHWHQARGFGLQGYHIGYHFVIYRDGSIHTGRPLELPGAHCRGHNANSIGICYIGGLVRQRCPPRGDVYLPKDTRTPAQRSALRNLIAELQKQFPAATLHCHHEYANKACPGFTIKDL